MDKTKQKNDALEQSAMSERELMLRLMKLLNTHNSTRELIGTITALLQEWSGCEAVGVRLRDGGDFRITRHAGFRGSSSRPKTACA